MLSLPSLVFSSVRITYYMKNNNNDTCYIYTALYSCTPNVVQGDNFSEPIEFLSRNSCCTFRTKISLVQRHFLYTNTLYKTSYILYSRAHLYFILNFVLFRQSSMFFVHLIHISLLIFEPVLKSMPLIWPFGFGLPIYI